MLACLTIFNRSHTHTHTHTCTHVHVYIHTQLGYACHSVLASTWLVATTAKLKRKNNSNATTTGSEDASLNLCGGGCGAKGGVAEGGVRQWVYYYVRRVRTELLWDSLPRDQLKAVLEVCVWICVCKWFWNTVERLLKDTSLIRTVSEVPTVYSCINQPLKYIKTPSVMRTHFLGPVVSTIERFHCTREWSIVRQT